MKEKILIKVIASVIVEVAGRMRATTARGISPLKRGETMSDFISSFMEEREVTTYSVHQRSEDTWATSPIMSLNEEPKSVITYHFVQFPASEIGFNAKDLAALELERDMKHLKKIING
jgi:hypothetical protein